MNCMGSEEEQDELAPEGGDLCVDECECMSVCVCMSVRTGTCMSVCTRDMRVCASDSAPLLLTHSCILGKLSCLISQCRARGGPACPHAMGSVSSALLLSATARIPTWTLLITGLSSRATYGPLGYRFLVELTCF
jgi:hypothetical protein